MKVVVIGGTGLIGSKLVPRLTALGNEAVAASPDTGVNTLTGEGLADVLKGAAVVVDVSNSPSLEGEAAMAFFTASTRNLISYELAAGVQHHIALSVVGTDRLQESGYFQAKLAQENLIEESGRPYSIVHATQFFEFVKAIANAGTVEDEVRLSSALIQPMAAEEVAAALARTATGEPVNGMIEVAGPDVFSMDEFIRLGLEEDDKRKVVADPQARYFGALLSARELLPGPDARLSEVHFQAWLAQNSPRARGALAASQTQPS